MPQDASRSLIGVDLGGSGFRVRRLRRLAGASLILQTDDEGEETEARWGEAEPGPARCERLAAAIRARIESGGGRPALVAIAAPGEKTEDGRGIGFAWNFPAITDLLGGLARALAGCGVEFACPLFGDGVAAARGEQVEPGGALRDVRRGYYLGGGTGVSEALVVDGEVLVCPLRAYELPAANPPGETLEERLSARRLHALLERVRDEEHAGERLGRFVTSLKELVEERSAWMRRYPAPGSPGLERVVLGQGYANFRERGLEAALLDGFGCQAHLSSLRAAPAIGAVAFALDHEVLHGRDAWISS